MEKLNIISWSSFQQGINDLWKSPDPRDIPIYNNPFNLIRYSKAQICKNIILFPCQYQLNGKIVGFISIYNLSNLHIRPRGIYIKPEFRGKGLGHRMQRAAWDLFPKTFYRAFIITSQVDRFCKYSNMTVFPNVPPLWSEYSKSNLTLLYHQRSTYPSVNSILANKSWIKEKIKHYGLGGVNNLNVSWTSKQWVEYFKIHKGNYKSMKFNLDYPNEKI